MISNHASFVSLHMCAREVLMAKNGSLLRVFLEICRHFSHHTILIGAPKGAPIGAQVKRRCPRCPTLHTLCYWGFITIFCHIFDINPYFCKNLALFLKPGTSGIVDKSVGEPPEKYRKLCMWSRDQMMKCKDSNQSSSLTPAS